MLPLARRPARHARAVAPSGYANPVTAPGDVTVALVVEFARGADAQVDLAQAARVLDAALLAAGVGAGRARRAGALTIARAVGLGERRVVTLAAPVTVTASIPWRDLSRAIVRAFYWSALVLQNGLAVARDAGDGGAALQALAESYPAEAGDAAPVRLAHVTVTTRAAGNGQPVTTPVQPSTPPAARAASPAGLSTGEKALLAAVGLGAAWALWRSR